MRLGKTLGVPIFMVGHVTKEGYVAGPKILEHMVDTVLYFEGEMRSQHKILRAVKNRFGSTNEIGLFEDDGARANPRKEPQFRICEQSDVSDRHISCLHH